ncbi:MAG: hypothetical protein AAB325_16610 [Pseudomonadota bacterium]
MQAGLLLRIVIRYFFHHMLGNHEAVGMAGDQVHAVNAQKITSTDVSVMTTTS